MNIDRSYSYKQDGYTYAILFLVSHNLRRYRGNKSWPITTQCIIMLNNRIIAMAEVVKHDKDEPDPYAGRVYAAEKAIAQLRLWRGATDNLYQQVKSDRS